MNRLICILSLLLMSTFCFAQEDYLMKGVKAQRETELDSTGMLIRTITNSYDREGTLIRTVTAEATGISWTTIETYSYDEKGRNTLKVRMTEAEKIMDSVRYNYDEHDELIERISYFIHNNRMRKQRHEYVYRESRKWMKQDIYVDDELQWQFEREFDERELPILVRIHSIETGRTTETDWSYDEQERQTTSSSYTIVGDERQLDSETRYDYLDESSHRLLRIKTRYRDAVLESISESSTELEYTDEGRIRSRTYFENGRPTSSRKYRYECY